MSADEVLWDLGLPCPCRGGHAVGDHPVQWVPLAQVPPLVLPPSDACLCGHDAQAHEHYRRGSDCGACGRLWCPQYVRAAGASWPVRFLRWFERRFL